MTTNDLRIYLASISDSLKRIADQLEKDTVSGFIRWEDDLDQQAAEAVSMTPQPRTMNAVDFSPKGFEQPTGVTFPWGRPSPQWIVDALAEFGQWVLPETISELYAREPENLVYEALVWAAVGRYIYLNHVRVFHNPNVKKPDAKRRRNLSVRYTGLSEYWPNSWLGSAKPAHIYRDDGKYVQSPQAIMRYGRGMYQLALDQGWEKV